MNVQRDTAFNNHYQLPDNNDSTAYFLPTDFSPAFDFNISPPALNSSTHEASHFPPYINAQRSCPYGQQKPYDQNQAMFMAIPSTHSHPMTSPSICYEGGVQAPVGVSSNGNQRCCLETEGIYSSSLHDEHGVRLSPEIPVTRMEQPSMYDNAEHNFYNPNVYSSISPPEASYVPHGVPAMNELSLSKNNADLLTFNANNVPSTNHLPEMQHEPTDESLTDMGDIIMKEMRSKPVDVEFDDDISKTKQSDHYSAFPAKFLAFRNLVKQFHNVSESSCAKTTNCFESACKYTRKAYHIDAKYSSKDKGCSETSSKFHNKAVPSDNNDRNSYEQTPCIQTAKPEKTMFLTLLCPELKIKDPLVYLKFPFFYVQGEQLRPFLERCLKSDHNQAGSSGQDIRPASGNNIGVDGLQNNLNYSPQTPEQTYTDSILRDLRDNTYQRIPSDGSVFTTSRQSGAFISEFNFNALSEIIACLKKAHAENIGLVSTKLSVQKKEWILDIYKDLCHLREQIFGPMTTLKAEVHNGIFDVIGSKVDSSSDFMKHYVNSINEHLPNVIKFMCSVPGFRTLSLKDRTTLVTSSLVEYWYLGWYENLESTRGVLIDVEHKVLLSLDDLKDSFPAFFKFTKAQLEMAWKLAKLQLSPVEIILVKAISLLCPYRNGLEDPKRVESLFRKYRDCLRFLLCQNHQNPEQIFSELDAHLLEFRKLILSCWSNEDQGFDVHVHHHADTLHVTLGLSKSNNVML